MVDKEKIINTTNRSNGTVGYYVQDLDIRRDFNRKETKEVTFNELWKLAQQPGGKQLIKQCLVIDDAEAIGEILGQVEPEYFYSEADVKRLLNSGSVEQLIDCLNFAPEGVIDLVKSLSVSMEINDIRKRDAILEKTGFNVTKAIEINKETESEESNEQQGKRLASPINKKPEIPVRKTETPKVTVIKQDE